MADLDQLLSIATQIGAMGAQYLAEAGGHRNFDIATKATPTDLVTSVDQAIEALLVERLAELRPHDSIYAEEGTAIQGTSGVEWVIDPLDGTTDFVYDHPGYSVSIAALIDAEPAVGVVADPVHDEIFSARRGGGAHRNGSPIRISTADELSLALVATGFSYSAAERKRQAQILVEVLPRIRDIRRMGGAAVDLCSMAAGRVDAYFERGLQRWDLAAGALIAAEAGARVGDLDGGPPSYEYCISAPPSLFGPLCELLASCETQ